MQCRHLRGIPIGDTGYSGQGTAAMEHAVRSDQTCGIPAAGIEGRQPGCIVEHVLRRGNIAHIPPLGTYDLLYTAYRHILHRERIFISAATASLRGLCKCMPVFHGLGIAGIIQRSVNGLDIGHIAEEPIGVFIGDYLIAVTGDDQGTIVFQPCDNRLILRRGNVPHIVVRFHQSACIAGLHVGYSVVAILTLELDLLDLTADSICMEIHIAVRIRLQSDRIRSVGPLDSHIHNSTGTVHPVIAITADHRRHTPLIRDPVIPLCNGILTHDLSRHIGIHIEGTRRAARGREGDIGSCRLLEGDDCQLIDMSEGHGVKAGQRRRQRQSRNRDIIEGPLPYRHQALRQFQAGNQLEIREGIVANGRHALHKGQAIRLILIVGPFRIRFEGKVLHRAGVVVKGILKLDPELSGRGVLLRQVAHERLGVLQRRSSPAHAHTVIQRSDIGICRGTVIRRGETASLLSHDYLFKGKFDTSRRLKGRRDGQGQVSCLILRSGRQHMCRQVEGNGLLIRTDLIGNVGAVNRELCVIRSIGIPENRQRGIRRYPCRLHGYNAVYGIFAGIALFQCGRHIFAGAERSFRRRALQRIAICREAGRGELHGVIHPIGEERHCHGRNHEQQHRYKDSDPSFTDTLRHCLFTPFLLSICCPLLRAADAVQHQHAGGYAQQGYEQPDSAL